MRLNAVVVGLALISSACAGAHGAEPELREVAAAGDVRTRTTTTTTTATVNQMVLITDPVAVASTTTIPAPASPPSTTTTLVTEPTTPPVTVPTVEIAAIPLPGTVALTFDDGPFVGWTETILAILEEHGVTATFFVSTYLLPANAHLIPLLVAAGHSVQSHSNHHDVLTEMTEEEVRSELATSIDRLVDAGAPRPTCFRPPRGATNETVNRIATELGLEIVMWDVDSFDYSHQEPGAVIDSTLNNIGPGDIVLMHDQWAPVLEVALPVIIQELMDREIGFSPLCLGGSRS